MGGLSVETQPVSSRLNRTLEAITLDAADMLGDTRRVIGWLEIDAERMGDNLDRTGGMIMSQRIVLFLGQSMGREEAELDWLEGFRRPALNLMLNLAHAGSALFTIPNPLVAPNQPVRSRTLATPRDVLPGACDPAT